MRRHERIEFSNDGQSGGLNCGNIGKQALHYMWILAQSTGAVEYIDLNLAEG